MKQKQISRRHALKTLAMGAASTLFLPRGLQAAPSNQLRLAFIGVGGWGGKAVNSLTKEHYIAFCDVDENRASNSYSKFPSVPRYKNANRMLEQHADEIDAVIITTPDHSHYPITMRCMEAGKHVYLEKPMATTPWECRNIAAEAEHFGVTTQLGLQGHSAAGLRVLREWVEAGTVGPVTDIWLWTDRTQPETSVWSETLPPRDEPIPPTLDWNGWLADRPYRPYSSLYTPTRWRNWWGFGSGAICDIGMHMFDVVRTVFDTEFPDVVEAEISDSSIYTTPLRANLRWQFPAKNERKPITVHWYNGWINDRQNVPSNIPNLPQGVIESTPNGMAFSGPDGTLFINDMRATTRPRIYPESREREVLASPPAKRYPRVKGNHYSDFFNAIRKNTPASTPFAYGAALTEQVLLGALAQRTQKPIRWDPKTMSAIGVPESDAFIRPERGIDAWKPSCKDSTFLPY